MAQVGELGGAPAVVEVIILDEQVVYRAGLGCGEDLKVRRTVDRVTTDGDVIALADLNSVVVGGAVVLGEMVRIVHRITKFRVLDRHIRPVDVDGVDLTDDRHPPGNKV